MDIDALLVLGAWVALWVWAIRRRLKRRNNVIVVAIGGDVDRGEVHGLTTVDGRQVMVIHEQVHPKVVFAVLEDIAGAPDTRVSGIPLRGYKLTYPPTYIADRRLLRLAHTPDDSGR